MTFDLVKQVISYLEMIQDYTDFLKRFLKDEAYDDFDRAYLGFFKEFEDFVWNAFNQPDSHLKKLIEQYEEFSQPVRQSMIAYCLEGLKHHAEALSFYNEGSMAERRRIFENYLNQHFCCFSTDFLDGLDEEQWEAFEREVFQIKTKAELESYIEKLISISK